MRVLFLGATGRTGRLILEKALDRGHIVHALVRDKQKISTERDNLTVFEGTPIDKAVQEKAMQCCEAVVSALNISRKYEFRWSGLRTPKDFLSATIKNVVELPDRHHISRIVFISAWRVYDTRKDLPGWFRWLINNSTLRHQYLDHERQEEVF